MCVYPFQHGQNPNPMQSKLEQSSHEGILPPGMHTCPNFTALHNVPQPFCLPLGEKQHLQVLLTFPRKGKDRNSIRPHAQPELMLSSPDGKDPTATAGDGAAKQNPGSINRTAWSTCSRQLESENGNWRSWVKKWDRRQASETVSEPVINSGERENKNHSFLSGQG